MRFPGILFASRANRNPSLVTALPGLGDAGDRIFGTR